MTEKFQNRYRIPSARASWWDYGRDAAYFVTICTHGRECSLGKIAEPQMVETRLIASLHQPNELIPSPIGEIAQTCWNEIPQHFSYAKLDSFVVMPNHIHGIIIIDKPVQTRLNDEPVETRLNDEPVETRLIASQQQPATKCNRQNKMVGGITGNKNPMLHDNLSRILRWFKGRSAYECHKINPHFEWQERFYDSIIRNDKSHWIVSRYILNNPKNWGRDRFHKK